MVRSARPGGPVDRLYQLERGGRWLHLPGRPDWLCADDAPEWARGALYTASSPLAVGDETWLYFTGTPDRHGWCGVDVDWREWRSATAGRGGFARIGVARWKRDRIMGYEAPVRECIHLQARPAAVGERARLALNAVIRPGGVIRVALLDGSFEPLAGYGTADCDALSGDQLEAEVSWRGCRELPRIGEAETMTARVEVDAGTLFAFDFARP